MGFFLFIYKSKFNARVWPKPGWGFFRADNRNVLSTIQPTKLTLFGLSWATTIITLHNSSQSHILVKSIETRLFQAIET